MERFFRSRGSSVTFKVLLKWRLPFLSQIVSFGVYSEAELQSNFVKAAPSLPPVTWQTIFWTLVPLAINAMSQPGGRVCGLSSRYRTYLRCSPLVCFADMVSIFMWMLILTGYQRLSFTEALGIALHRRFTENRDVRFQTTCPILESKETETEGIQKLERMTWLRWLWFVLGTLPPAIKLLSMRGVAWAQIWGLMFLLSWVVNELLIISASLNQNKFTISETGCVSWPGYEQSTRAPSYKRVERLLDLADRILAVTALNAHIVMMNGVFRVVSGTISAFPLRLIGTTPRYPLANSFNLDSTVSVSNSSDTNVLLHSYPYRRYTSIKYQFVVTIAMLIGLSVLGPVFRVKSVSLFLVPLGLFYLMLANSAANLTFFGAFSYTELYVFFVSFFIIPLFLLFLRYLSQRYSVLGQNLLVMSQGSNGHLKIHYGGCFALLFFIGTLFATLVWYCYVFDASGTSVPVWTGVFG